MGGERILIVKDESAAAEDLVETLAELGYEVIGRVCSGDEAVRLARDTRPDLVLIDVELTAEVTGIETAAGLISHSNPAVVHLTGMSPSEILDRAKLTGAYSYLIRPVSENAFRTTLERALHYREIHKRLRENEERLALALEGADLGWWDIDLKTSTGIFDNRCHQMLDYEPGELGRDFQTWQNLVHPEDHPMVTEALDSHTSGESPMFQATCRVETKTGAWKWITLRGKLVERDKKNKPIRLTGTSLDVTDQKLAEQELNSGRDKLREYTGLLEQQIMERTKNLRRSRDELEKKACELVKANDALKMMISGIAEEKRRVQSRIAENIRSTAKAIVHQMRNETLSARMKSLLDALESSLDDVAASMDAVMVRNAERLSLKEMRICEMIRAGLSSKEIAVVLRVSPKTVSFHRCSIRKKLGLASSKDNLADYLKRTIRDDRR